MAQTFCEVTYAFSIERNKFTPRPKVDSGLVKFEFKHFNNLCESKNAESFFDDLESLSRTIFRHKNKKLGTVQLPWSELGIDFNLRPHHLSPETIVNILNRL
jgi:16S rRNA A1518/A1519 N6-dimethyltransferase RsmA/KsgA/DIM1 with predicted DNA glycosylase/AP lyase activity